MKACNSPRIPPVIITGFVSKYLTEHYYIIIIYYLLFIALQYTYDEAVKK